ncbi:sensor histidine kinase [Micromonospora sp. NBC_01796]|uniref:sensor histidine kinase n=1 Tax=Micromonospora sp. NBC_01796 TaxID=2975987 RepID=UPI002DD96A37|nr:nitrate- and nitrite sensing domain-containing protein [Micromonospora sp. NBC_01796]WSA87732.1 nitrate- and nitrite sensing domain-containing protein [Micromonospora sp. NBC_01796]
MSTGPTTLPENGPPEHGARRRWLPRLRDTRIRSKLALILVVPVAAVLALATVRLVDVGQTAYDANMIRSLTALSIDVSALTQDLHKERMAAATYLADPAATADTYNLAVRRTDERITAYGDERNSIGNVPESMQSRIEKIDDHLATLNNTRQEVLDRKQMLVVEAVLRYGVILTDLGDYGETLGELSGEGRVADSLRAVAAFARAKAGAAEEQAVGFTALRSARLDEEQYSSFVATQTSQQEALASFELAASASQNELVDKTYSGDAVTLAERAASDVARAVGQPTNAAFARSTSEAIGAVIDLMRWAEVQLEVELLAQADQAQSDVIQQAVIESIVVLITLIVAIALAVILARSLNASLRRLREGALSVANHDLPDAVARLQNVGSIGDGGVEEIVRQVRDPIRLNNKDEIGQVALAFNVVHREAVRVAAEQAALRTSVSAMFLNLARRSQALVDRMIGELDMIERGEEDPKRLAQLFELDHLATRMRRNDENLLVLAGADSTAPRRDDALLVDALRAAQSEVEAYNRIEFGTVDTDISVAAHAVNDVVRLVAELLDNATRFSSPNTVVVADARRIRDYVLIQVEDRGLGLSEEQLDALNRRLAAPPTVDVAAFRLMGLAVVSRLASRYGIRVELRRNVEGGTVAQVTLPSETVVLPQLRGREPLATRPRQPLAVEPGPAAALPAGPSWSEPMTPVGAGRTSAATLTDQWRTTPPAQPQPMQWQTADVRDTTTPVGATAAPVTHQLAAQPTAAHPLVTPPPPATHPTLTAPVDSYAGTPTMAYPTVRSLPQRTVGAGVAPTPAPAAPVAAPSAGLPSGPVAGMTPTPPPAPPVAAAPAPRAPEQPGEAPIFREMEAVWFRSHGQDSTAIFNVPPGGYQTPPAPRTVPAPRAAEPAAQRASLAESVAARGRATLPARTPGQTTSTGYTPPQAPAVPAAPVRAPEPVAAPVAAPVSPPAGTGTEAWRTAADEGWARATRAAEPAASGTTRSGLPKRVPQAQLVPGGVETKPGQAPSRRTPDEVRGLLSAYHRGVQRGRTAGSEQNGTTSTKETSR